MSDDSAFRIMSREMAGRLLIALAIIAFACLTGGCATTIDEHQAPPDGWPALEQKTVYVGFVELQRRCYQYLSLTTKLLGGFAFQCVVIDFPANTCTQYRPEDETTGDDHERMHCQGYSHYGETWAHDALRAYQLHVAGEAVAKAAR